MKTSANVGHALRNMGNKPGMDSGDVVVRKNDGTEIRLDTDLVTITDLGLIIGTVDNPERFIPMGSVSEIAAAPAAK